MIKNKPYVLKISTLAIFFPCNFNLESIALLMLIEFDNSVVVVVDGIAPDRISFDSKGFNKSVCLLVKLFLGVYTESISPLFTIKRNN